MTWSCEQESFRTADLDESVNITACWLQMVVVMAAAATIIIIIIIIIIITTTTTTEDRLHYKM
jgi:hypothetical protein